MTQLDWDPESVSTRGGSASDAKNTQQLLRCVEVAAYEDWLDMMSAIYYRALSTHKSEASDFRNRLNGALLRHHSAYSMDPSGLMVESGSAVSEQAIEQARAILADPAMEGPDRQFQDAVLDLTRRPSPNCEGAVANAVNALEGICRLVLNDAKITLGDAIKAIGRAKSLHPALAQSVEKLYGYGSDAGGRHGVVGAPDPDQVIAEFVVHQCAAGIVLVARLYGLAVA